MFDFAISQYQKHPPTRRMLMSGVVSCAIHLAAVAALVAYPELLLGGVGHWFRTPVIAGSTEEKAWRTVTFVGHPGMQTPSAATLKKYMYDFEAAAAAAAAAGKNPPISVRWGNEPQATEKAEDKTTPVRPVPGNEEPAPVTAAQPGSGVQPGEAGGEQGGTGPGRTVYLPAPAAPRPEPPKTADVNVAPKSIPDSVQPPPSTPAPAPQPAAQAPAVKVFEDEQKAIRSEGTGFFGTKGFPLGDYASIIIERIKGNWMIPSNLRNSQGRTTVVFFIGKDGRYTNAHIVTSSGSTSLDLAALNAVLVSNPFPPLPTGFPGEQVGAKFVFSYNERQ